jgi:hypothetical protein
MAGRLAADEVIEIADGAKPETVCVARLRCEQRRWYAEKMNPAEFGERIGVAVQAEIQVEQVKRECESDMTIQESVE